MKSKISNLKSRICVGVVFGGRSAEHEVSLVSAASIINALDKKKYEVIPIGITPEGKWVSSPDVLKRMKDGVRKNIPENILLPDPSRKSLIEIDKDSIRIHGKKIDVFFPVLHGTYGEDGTIQGLFELASIPYAGAGVLGSSVGMDKVMTKQLCEQAGIPVTPYIWFLKTEFKKRGQQFIRLIERKIGYPCFVKPVNMGSSVGISKANNRKQLVNAIYLASEYDRKILVEKSVEDAREIEVSVLGNDDPIASTPGEIISSNEFYDYDAKYVDGKSQTIIPAKLSKEIIGRLKDLSVRGFRAIDCAGMARVDFLVAKQTHRIYFNEINTIPGFTSISMYPKLWEASGISYPDLLNRLINLAIVRHKEKSKLKTMFKPKNKWYK
jgi:D-alanine-D-alanine ligase